MYHPEIPVTATSVVVEANANDKSQNVHFTELVENAPFISEVENMTLPANPLFTIFELNNPLSTKQGLLTLTKTPERVDALKICPDSILIPVSFVIDDPQELMQGILYTLKQKVPTFVVPLQNNYERLADLIRCMNELTEEENAELQHMTSFTLSTVIPAFDGKQHRASSGVPAFRMNAKEKDTYEKMKNAEAADALKMFHTIEKTLEKYPDLLPIRSEFMDYCRNTLFVTAVR